MVGGGSSSRSNFLNLHCWSDGASIQENLPGLQNTSVSNPVVSLKIMQLRNADYADCEALRGTKKMPDQ